MRESIIVENDIFGPERDEGRDGLYTLSLRARHDPSAWAILSRRAKQHSYAAKYVSTTVDSDSENRGLRDPRSPDKSSRSSRRSRGTPHKDSRSRRFSTQPLKGYEQRSDSDRFSRRHRSTNAPCTYSIGSSPVSPNVLSQWRGDGADPVAAPVRKLIESTKEAVEAVKPAPSAVDAGARAAEAGARAARDAGLCGELEDLARRLRELRADRLAQSPKSPLTGPNYNEVQMLVSVGVTSRKAVCRHRSINPPAAQKAALHALVNTGVVGALYNGLVDGVVPCDTSGGRAILAVAAEAANDPITAKLMAQKVDESPPEAAKLCRDVMENLDQPPETRHDAASIVLDVSETDPHLKKQLLQADPDIIATAEKVRQETEHLLVQSAVVRRKRRPAKGIDQTPLPSYQARDDSSGMLLRDRYESHDLPRQGSQNLSLGFLDARSSDLSRSDRVPNEDLEEFDAKLEEMRQKSPTIIALNTPHEISDAALNQLFSKGNRKVFNLAAEFNDASPASQAFSAVGPPGKRQRAGAEFSGSRIIAALLNPPQKPGTTLWSDSPRTLLQGNGYQRFSSSLSEGSCCSNKTSTSKFPGEPFVHSGSCRLPPTCCDGSETQISAGNSIGKKRRPSLASSVSSTSQFSPFEPITVSFLATPEQLGGVDLAFADSGSTSSTRTDLSAGSVCRFPKWQHHIETCQTRDALPHFCRLVEHSSSLWSVPTTQDSFAQMQGKRQLSHLPSDISRSSIGRVFHPSHRRRSNSSGAPVKHHLPTWALRAPILPLSIATDISTMAGLTEAGQSFSEKRSQKQQRSSVACAAEAPKHIPLESVETFRFSLFPMANQRGDPGKKLLPYQWNAAPQDKRGLGSPTPEPYFNAVKSRHCSTKVPRPPRPPRAPIFHQIKEQPGSHTAPADAHAEQTQSGLHHIFGSFPNITAEHFGVTLKLKDTLLTNHVLKDAHVTKYEQKPVAQVRRFRTRSLETRSTRSPESHDRLFINPMSGRMFAAMGPSTASIPDGFNLKLYEARCNPQQNIFFGDVAGEGTGKLDTQSPEYEIRDSSNCMGLPRVNARPPLFSSHNNEPNGGFPTSSSLRTSEKQFGKDRRCHSLDAIDRHTILCSGAIAHPKSGTLEQPSSIPVTESLAFPVLNNNTDSGTGVFHAMALLEAALGSPRNPREVFHLGFGRECGFYSIEDEICNNFKEERKAKKKARRVSLSVKTDSLELQNMVRRASKLRYLREKEEEASATPTPLPTLNPGPKDEVRPKKSQRIVRPVAELLLSAREKSRFDPNAGRFADVLIAVDDFTAKTDDIFLEEIAAYRVMKHFRKGHVTQLGNLLMQAARVGKVRKFVEYDGHELLLNLMKKCEGDRKIIGVCLEAFARAADADPFLRDFCLQSVQPAINPKAAASDPTAAASYVALMTDALVRKRPKKKGQGLEESSMQMLKRNLDVFMQTWDNNKHTDPLALSDTIQFLHRVLCEDGGEFTLKKAHQELVIAQRRGPLCLDHDRLLRRLCDYIFELMEIYCRSSCTVDSFTGQEIMYGCLCFQIFAGEQNAVENPDQKSVLSENSAFSPAAKESLDSGSLKPTTTMQTIAAMSPIQVRLANEQHLLKYNLPGFLLRSMLAQETPQVAQHLVLTALDLCGADAPKSSSAPAPGQLFRRALADSPGAASTTTEMVQRGIRATDGGHPLEIEDLVRPRLELIQKLAYNRRIYASTAIVEHLIRLWNDSDLFHYEETRFRTLDDVKKWVKRERRESQFETIGAVLRKGVGRRGSNADASNCRNADNVARKRSIGGSPGTTNADNSPNAPGATAAIPTGRSPLQRRSSAVRTGLPPAVTAPSTPSTNAASPGPSPGGTSVGSPSPARASVMQRRASMAAAKRSQSVASVASQMSLLAGDSSDGLNHGWDEEDLQLLADNGPVMIPPVMKTLRVVICGAFIDTLKRSSVPLRLTGLISDKTTNPAALPDILFLIGALAAVPDLKDYFGEVTTIERILDLIRRAYVHDGLYIAEIVSNSCLALASLCVVHTLNTNRFNKYKGTELVVAVLRKRGEINDTKGVNGASALVCNLCFRNEEMKKLLGQKGACEALVKILEDYENQHGEVGTRCISSTFKAIGNLALNSENMNAFIGAEIHNAVASFLTEIDQELDDSTLEACFRTVANLVIEKDNMERFVTSVIPVLAVLRRIHKDPDTSADIYRWIFETIGNLCRWPESAKLFTINEGIETVLLLLKYLPDSISLHASAIYVLGVQTSDRANIPLLVNSGLIEFTVHVINQYVFRCKEFEAAGGDLSAAVGGGATGFASTTPSPPTTAQNNEDEQGPSMPENVTLVPPSPQLPIAGMRCLRRVLVSRANAQRCVDAGGLKAVLSAFYTTPERSMLVYEAWRIIFSLIYLFGDDLDETERAFAAGGIANSNADAKPLQKRRSMLGASKTTRVAQTARAMRLASLRPGGLDADISRRKSNLRQGTMLRGLRGNAAGGDDGGNLSPALQKAKYAGYGDEDEPRDRVPLGERAWQTLCFTEAEIVKLIKTTRKVLADDRVSRNLRLYRLGIGLMCYFACEKVGWEGFYERLAGFEPEETQTAAAPIAKWDRVRRRSLVGLEKESPAAQGGALAKAPLTKRKSIIAFFTGTNKKDDDFSIDLFGTDRPPDRTAVIDLIYHVFDTFLLDTCVVESAVLLLIHLLLCAQSLDELEAVADQTFFKETKKIIFSEDAALSTAKEALRLYEFVLKRGRDTTAEDMQPYYHLVDFVFPLEFSGWNDDPYPDGPASLPPDMKQYIRDGGRLVAYIIEGSKPKYKVERKTFDWRATHDMLQLQWKLADAKEKAEIDPQYPHSVPISIINGILPGATNEAFSEVCKSSGISEATCFGLVGPKTPEFPNGICLNLRAKSQKDRDSLVGVFTFHDIRPGNSPPETGHAGVYYSIAEILCDAMQLQWFAAAAAPYIIPPVLPPGAPSIIPGSVAAMSSANSVAIIAAVAAPFFLVCELLKLRSPWARQWRLPIAATFLTGIVPASLAVTYSHNIWIPLVQLILGWLIGAWFLGLLDFAREPKVPTKKQQYHANEFCIYYSFTILAAIVFTIIAGIDSSKISPLHTGLAVPSSLYSVQSLLLSCIAALAYYFTLNNASLRSGGRAANDIVESGAADEYIDDTVFDDHATRLLTSPRQTRDMGRDAGRAVGDDELAKDSLKMTNLFFSGVRSFAIMYIIVGGGFAAYEVISGKQTSLSLPGIFALPSFLRLIHWRTMIWMCTVVLTFFLIWKVPEWLIVTGDDAPRRVTEPAQEIWEVRSPEALHALKGDSPSRRSSGGVSPEAENDDDFYEPEMQRREFPARAAKR